MSLSLEYTDDTPNLLYRVHFDTHRPCIIHQLISKDSLFQESKLPFFPFLCLLCVLMTSIKRRLVFSSGTFLRLGILDSRSFMTHEYRHSASCVKVILDVRIIPDPGQDVVSHKLYKILRSYFR